MKKIVFTLPFAGGTSLTYKNWKFEKDIRHEALDYKGHGFRFFEELDSDFMSMVDDVYNMIENKIDDDTEYIIMGHSMGAMVAFFVTHKIEKMGLKTPCRLIVSGCLPQSVFPLSRIKKYSDDNILNEYINEFGRIDANRITTDIYEKKIFPMIKNDFINLSRLDEYRILSDLKNDIICYYSENDSLMPFDNMIKWNEITKGSVEYNIMEGNHFYIEDSACVSKICERINEIFL